MSIFNMTDKVVKTSLNLIGACLFCVFSPAYIVVASELHDADKIPHVGKRARESYVSYLYADNHKAFAIGPGGAWAWQEGLATKEEAQQKAIEFCQKYTEQQCVTYALNNTLVFDKQQWPTLWGPYLSKTEAAKVEEGKQVGQRFHDLSFKTEKGKKLKLSDYRGKVVLIHFWGSWCPSCNIEFHSLKRLNLVINRYMGQQVELIILQAREPFSTSRAWADENGFEDIRLYDSQTGENDNTDFFLTNGKTLPDRAIAKVFPSSYVLDKNGVVVFSHSGAVNEWMEYMDFLLHVAAESGQKVLSKK